MEKFIIAAIAGGVALSIMDALINGNPLAAKLLECYKPLARKALNIPFGVLANLFQGLIITWIFLSILPVLPSENEIITGLIYGCGIWFFKVFMGTVSNWLTFNIPAKTLLYTLTAGLIEMIIIGVINSLLLS